MLRFGFVLVVTCVLLADASYNDQPLYQIVELSKPMKGLYVSGPVDVYFVEESSSDACRIEARGSFVNKTLTVLHAQGNKSKPMITIKVEPFESEQIETIVIYHKSELSAIMFATSGRVETIGRGIVKADDEGVFLDVEEGNKVKMNFDVSKIVIFCNRTNAVYLTGTIRDNAVVSVTDTSLFDVTNLKIESAVVTAESASVVKMGTTKKMITNADKSSKILYRLPNDIGPKTVHVEPEAEIR